MRASLMPPIDLGALFASVKGPGTPGKADAQVPVDVTRGPQVEPFSNLMAEFSQPDANPKGKSVPANDNSEPTRDTNAPVVPVLLTSLPAGTMAALAPTGPGSATVVTPPVRWTNAVKPSLSPAAEQAPKKSAGKQASHAANDGATVNVAPLPAETKPPVGIPTPTPVGNPTQQHENPKPGPTGSRVQDGNSRQPEHASTESTPQEHAQPVPAAPPTVPSDSASIETAKIAFEARLRPLTPQALPPATPGAVEQPNALKPQASAPEIRPTGTSESPRTQPVVAPAGKQDDNTHEPPERQSKPTPAAPTHSKAEFTSADLPLDDQPKTNPMVSTAPAQPASPGRQVDPAPSKTTPAPAQAAPEPDQAPHPPSAPSDIKIAVNDGGQRVELRVVERAGDIHVTVRTPDDRLATTLREDLPSLSAKLERSGFQSEMWRPSASASGEPKTIETSSGNAAHDSHEQAGGRQQQDNPQQNPRNPQQAPNRKSDRKEFAWLLQSIR
jgi:hypothetical protein